MAAKNLTFVTDKMICRKMGYITSYSIWQNQYALAPTVILTSQLVVISLASLLIDFWLRQVGQTSVVSQVIAGILLGPSVFGQSKTAARTLFPPEGYTTLATLAALGNMFYHFLIAVKTDPTMILRPGRVAMFIATIAFSTTMFFSILLAVLMSKYIAMDQELRKGVILISMTQAFTGVSVISYLITELKLQNTDVGRLSLSVAVFSDVLNIIMVTLSFVLGDGILRHQTLFLWAVLTTFAVAFVILFVIRPVILTMINNMPPGEPVDQKHIFLVITIALILGFVSETIGQHYLFGPLVFGLVVPEGPPLGAALVSRLGTFVSGFLYPTYLAISGLQTNLLKIKITDIGILGTIVIFAMMVKTGAVMSAGIYMKVPPRDAFVLSMIMNSKGIMEITIFNFWKENKIIQQEEFSVCILSVVATTAIMTPLIRYFYDPTKQSQPFKRNTLQLSRPDSELRMLVCIHNAENVPTLVNLLEISHATPEGPVSVISLVLVELVGRSVPVLLSNDNHVSHHKEATTANKFTNALRVYVQNNKDRTSIQSFTSISSFDVMHLDIFRVAIERRAGILIMPFHKKWAIDGKIESASTCIRQMNWKVLESAPCSVGILVDRGILKGSLSLANSMTKFNVAVIFIGGPDDAESLAYGARMVKHESVILTVIRFLLFGSENTIERKRDTELILYHKQANIGTERFFYVEEVVRDGLGLSKYIGKLVKYFDLILVGRYHQDSPLFTGLEDWSECPELGVIGDMLASPDFKTTASVLVIQQQRIRASKRESRAQFIPGKNIS